MTDSAFLQGRGTAVPRLQAGLARDDAAMKHDVRTNTGPGEEAALIERVLAGETDAFAALVRARRQEVSRAVSRRVPPDKAAETVCEVFSRAYLALSGYRGEKPFSHWLAVIAARTCHDFWRKAYRERETPVSGLSEAGRAMVAGVASEDRDGSPEQAFEKREAAELVAYALSGLSATDRMVVTLMHLEERSAAETAELLGISRANVKIRAFRARRALRGKLAAALGEE